MNIRKMFVLLITLILVYIGFQCAFQLVSKGHNVEYTIKTSNVKLKVKEIYTRNEKDERNNYYFEIKDSNDTFTLELFHDFKNRNYVIKDIKYLKTDNYTCIYPIFKTEEQLTDILCIKDHIIYPYQSIKGKDKEIDSFKDSLVEIYTEEQYQNDLTNDIKKEGNTFYRNNLLDKHYLALENYKGLYLFNKKDIYKKMELFKNDQYKKTITAFYENKYITADYNQDYTFNEFYVVDIKTLKQSKVISNQALSLDAYTMGVVENKVYIYDKSKKEQYTVDLKNNTISKVGNTSSGIKVYANGAWKDYSSYDAFENEKTFHEYKVEDEKFEHYDRVDKIGNNLSGYYYLYKKEKDIYKVYKVSVQNLKVRTFLFETTNIENIVYQNDYIYYINGNTINYYKEDTYIKTILMNKELEFNKNLKFGLFIS